jgi:small subunit ribosomal protein S4
LFLKGERCSKGACAINKGRLAPGQSPTARPKNLSEYGQQTREKQKTKRIYGVLEKQFRQYFEVARRTPGVTGENMLRLLEMRLDNVVYRLGYGRSRTEARQVVRHNLITVNGKRVNIPSYQVKVGDVVSVADKSKSLQRFKDVLDVTGARAVPEWLNGDAAGLRGTVVMKPNREHITYDLRETLIVELYSK